jgi:hypothetical protein
MVISLAMQPSYRYNDRQVVQQQGQRNDMMKSLVQGRRRIMKSEVRCNQQIRDVEEFPDL